MRLVLRVRAFDALIHDGKERDVLLVHLLEGNELAAAGRRPVAGVTVHLLLRTIVGDAVGHAAPARARGQAARGARVVLGAGAHLATADLAIPHKEDHCAIV